MIPKFWRYWEKTNRVTIDLDSNSPAFLMLSEFALIENLGSNLEKLEVYESSSGRGFHLIAILKKPITYRKQFAIRSVCRDCRNRLKYSKKDLLKGWNPDILFTSKKIKGEWKNARKISECNFSSNCSGKTNN